MKNTIAILTTIFLSACVGHTQAANENMAHPVNEKASSVKPTVCIANGFIERPACIFSFNELLVLKTQSQQDNRMGVEVAGVIMRHDSQYYFYENVINAKSDNQNRRIKITNMRDPDIDGDIPVLLGVNVVIVGYFTRLINVDASLDVYIVRKYGENGEK